MNDLVCKVKIKSKNSLLPFKKINIAQYGFLILQDFNIDFQQYVNGLKTMQQTLKISQNKGNITFIPKLSHKNFHYQRITDNPGEILWRNFDVQYEQLQIKDMFLNNGDIYYVKARRMNGLFKVNQVKDQMDDDELSFLNSSHVNSKLISYKKISCQICKQYKKELDLFEICDCKQTVHQQCFVDKFDKNTTYEDNQNFSVMTINDFYCKNCNKTFESKLKSIFNKYN